MHRKILGEKKERENIKFSKTLPYKAKQKKSHLNPTHEDHFIAACDPKIQNPMVFVKEIRK